MKMTSNIPDHADDCEAVLEGFVEAARLQIRRGWVPPFPHDVKSADGRPGIRYQLEPPGEEDWKLPFLVLRDGWGDCEDLAIWVAAGYRETGESPDARVRIVRTGRGKLHALVEHGPDDYEDPSVELMTPEDMRRYTDAAPDAS